MNKAHFNYFCLRTSYQLLPLKLLSLLCRHKGRSSDASSISWPSPPCGEGRVPLWFWGHPLAQLLLLLWAHLLQEQLLQRRAPTQRDNQQCPAAGASSRHFEASSTSWKQPVDDVPLYPRGWVSSRFHQHQPSATSAPLRPPQGGLDLRPQRGAGSPFLRHSSQPWSPGPSSCVQFLYSLAFSLLLSSQSPVISSLCYS